MRMGLRDIDWDQAGAMLAQGDSDDQIAFFKAFVKECLGWGTKLQVEKQLAIVNLGLTEGERSVLGMLSYEEGVA